MAEDEALPWPRCAACTRSPRMNCEGCRALAPTNPVTYRIQKKVRVGARTSFDALCKWHPLVTLQHLPTSPHVAVTGLELHAGPEPTGPPLLQGIDELACDDATAPTVRISVRVPARKAMRVAAVRAELYLDPDTFSNDSAEHEYFTWGRRPTEVVRAPPDATDFDRWAQDERERITDTPWDDVLFQADVDGWLAYNIDAHRYTLVDPDRWTGPGRWDQPLLHPRPLVDILADEKRAIT